MKILNQGSVSVYNVINPFLTHFTRGFYKAIFGWIRQVKGMPAFENCEILKQSDKLPPTRKMNVRRWLVSTLLTHFYGQ